MTGRRYHASIGWRGGVAALAALLGAVSAAGAQTVIQGRVISGRDSSALGPVEVQLHRVTATGGGAIDSTVAGADGRFRFVVDTTGGPGTLYLAAARREGVLFFGPALHAGMGADEPYLVVVYDPQPAPGPVEGARIGLRHVVLSRSAHGILEVAEVLDVAGIPGQAWVPGPDSIAVFRARLPSGARGLEILQGGIAPETLRLQDGVLEARAALPPAGFRVAIAYFADGPELRIPVDHPTDRLDVILVGSPADRVEGLQPAAAGGMPLEGAVRYTASDLAPGANVALRVTEPSSTGGSALVWLGIGLALLAAAAVSAVLIGRSRAA